MNQRSSDLGNLNVDLARGNARDRIVLGHLGRLIVQSHSAMRHQFSLMTHNPSRRSEIKREVGASSLPHWGRRELGRQVLRSVSLSDY